MAKSIVSLKGLDIDLECSICLDNFVDPRKLPCLHTFCLKCLLEHCEATTDGDKSKCPLCRGEFTIPKGGVEKLDKNLFIMRLVLEKKAKEGHSVEERCELCIDLGKVVEASIFCMHCQHNLCTRCKVRHDKLIACRHHKTVDIKNKPCEAELERLKSNYCAEHEGEELKMFCCNCKLVHCQQCHAKEHNTHPCKIIGEAAEETRKVLHGYIQKLDKHNSERLAKSEALNKAKEKFMNQIQTSERAIRERCAELRCMIDKCEEKYFMELNQIKNDRLKEVFEIKDSLDHCKVELESYKIYCKTLIERGTDCEIVRASEELNKRAEELIKSQARYNKQLSKKSVKFIPLRSTTSVDDMKHLIGSIYEHINTGELFMDPDCDIRSTFTGSCIQGLTVVDDEVFVVHTRQSHIQVGGSTRQILPSYNVIDMKEQQCVNVYASESLALSRQVNIPEMGYPEGLAGSAHNNALYISDWSLRCIHRVNLDNNSVTHWTICKGYVPGGLAVTIEHNLLVTVRISSCGGESRVMEYKDGGQLVREIILDESIKHAWQTVQLSSNQFIISHGSEWIDSSLHRVCVINSEGQIIKSYGGEKGAGKEELNSPWSLVIDSKSKCIFVADINKRIVILDSNLSYLGKVHTVPDQHEPCKLYFDSLTDRMFVGQRYGRLLVIKPE